MSVVVVPGGRRGSRTKNRRSDAGWPKKFGYGVGTFVRSVGGQGAGGSGHAHVHLIPPVFVDGLVLFVYGRSM